MTPDTVSPALAADTRSLDGLKLRAKINPDGALRDVAQQFETLFMNMLLKSMREATPHDGPFDSEQSRFYTSMLDQQLSEKLSARGLGLADMMVRQLRPTVPGADGPAAAGAGVTPVPLSTGHTRQFVDRLWPHAAAASRATGIPAHFIVGHAALESGWGAHEIQGADGAPSHNVFGIKAGSGWRGRTATVVTTEYVDGVAQKTVDRFRAYDSYADAFRDYAQLIRTNPRYANAAQAGDPAGFARGLQQGGYATDPLYADKLARVINSQVLRHGLQA